MIPRFKIPFAGPVLCALAVSLLSGCATVSKDAVRSSSYAPSSLSNRVVANVETSSPGSANVSDPEPAAASGPEALPLIEVSAPSPITRTVDLTHECDDLFQRIRNGFSMPDINNDLVLYHQQWYMSHPNYLRRMVERSSLYLHYIVEKLDKRGMPMEIALLPMVESAYNPMAYSSARASGLWQFIPSTGKRYNLDQDWWKDERRDIVASTTAALDYLQSIYDMHGDWQLALASYNWGEGAVARAISKNEARGLPTDYTNLSMPRETRNYVPKLQALKNIFSSPALLAELGIDRIPNRPYFSTVNPPSNIDVKLAAKLAEMPVQKFVALNPAYNRPVITSDSPLVIPAEKYDTFMSNLEAYEASNKPLSSWQTYTVRRGDKLEKIAPRFGMSVASLKAANGVRGRLRIRPGITLLVACKECDKPVSMTAPSDQMRFPDAAPEPTTNARSHKVRHGDTLLSIARHYGMTVAELKRINHLRGNTLVAGKDPTISGRRDVRAERAPLRLTGASSKKTARTGQTTKIARYTVRRGDTLASIARQFKVEIDDLKRWNNISARVIHPGKTLTIKLARNP